MAYVPIVSLFTQYFCLIGLYVL